MFLNTIYDLVFTITTAQNAIKHILSSKPEGTHISA